MCIVVGVDDVVFDLLLDWVCGVIVIEIVVGLEEIDFGFCCYGGIDFDGELNWDI